ncbi:trans-aconitate 2-methyltransferase [Methylocystis sp. IM3]|uniref:trans-aconitate 2-methyltransferase n=1 Tax=unclassified Methylocystis TaxID=2625913 RepID=UPI000FABFFC1|nr:MAG: trans-aconitate 2-methyltransferase [Hyphomicrobiales bacterium]
MTAAATIRGETRRAAQDWNSDLYLKFEEERTRAARDLLARIPYCETRRIFDLGCGPGNSTELLARNFPGAEIVGVDKSDNMLAVARARVPAARFLKEDIALWRPPASADVIFANATLHFLPDHRRLITRLVDSLAPGGRLAVQMPDNTYEPSHAAMRMVAADGPWADRLVPVAKSLTVIGHAEEYYDLLAPLCRFIDIWKTVYVHPLEGPDDVVQWFEGSGLRPFLDLLSPQESADFLAQYRERLAQAYPRQPNGKVLLRYPRLFFVLQK